MELLDCKCDFEGSVRRSVLSGFGTHFSHVVAEAELCILKWNKDNHCNFLKQFFIRTDVRLVGVNFERRKKRALGKLC